MYSELSMSLYLLLFVLSVLAAPPPGPFLEELGAVVGGKRVRNSDVDQEVFISRPIIDYDVAGSSVVW